MCVSELNEPAEGRVCLTFCLVFLGFLLEIFCDYFGHPVALLVYFLQSTQQVNCPRVHLVVRNVFSSKHHFQPATDLQINRISSNGNPCAQTEQDNKEWKRCKELGSASSGNMCYCENKKKATPEPPWDLICRHCCWTPTGEVVNRRIQPVCSGGVAVAIVQPRDLTCCFRCPLPLWTGETIATGEVQPQHVHGAGGLAVASVFGPNLLATAGPAPTLGCGYTDTDQL